MGRSTRRMYVSAARRIAVSNRRKVRLTGKRNSAEDWTTASNPTKAQGTMARILSTCIDMGPPVENAGAMVAIPPL